MFSLHGKSLLLLRVLSDCLKNARTCTRAGVQDVLFAELMQCCTHARKKNSAHLGPDELFCSYNYVWSSSLFKMPIDNAIQKAKEVVHPNSHLNHEFLGCGYDPLKAMEKRYSKLEGLKESAGLCLRCVRSGNADADFPCTLKH